MALSILPPSSPLAAALELPTVPSVVLHRTKRSAVRSVFLPGRPLAGDQVVITNTSTGVEGLYTVTVGFGDRGRPSFEADGIRFRVAGTCIGFPHLAVRPPTEDDMLRLSLSKSDAAKLRRDRKRQLVTDFHEALQAVERLGQEINADNEGLSETLEVRMMACLRNLRAVVRQTLANWPTPDLPR